MGPKASKYCWSQDRPTKYNRQQVPLLGQGRFYWRLLTVASRDRPSACRLRHRLWDARPKSARRAKCSRQQHPRPWSKRLGSWKHLPVARPASAPRRCAPRPPLTLGLLQCAITRKILFFRSSRLVTLNLFGKRPDGGSVLGVSAAPSPDEASSGLTGE